MFFLDDIDVETSEFGELYDELPLWSAPFGLMLLDRVPTRAGMTIVDVGAGTGFLSVELAERCGPTSTVVAVDPWSAAIARLRRKVEQRKLFNVEIFECDAVALPLSDHSVDLFVSNLGVNNFADPTAVMETCGRLAKPNADFVLTTNLVGHMSEFYDVFHGVLTARDLSVSAETLERHVHARATTESVTELLATGGFTVTDVTRDTFRWRFANGSALLRHFFIRFAFLPSWRAIVPPDHVEDVFAELEAELNAVAHRNGELTLTVPMACVQARMVAPVG